MILWNLLAIKGINEYFNGTSCLSIFTENEIGTLKNVPAHFGLQ